MIQNWLRAAALGLLVAEAAMAEPTYTMLTFDDLADWPTDDHAAALTVFTDTCGDMKDPEWAGLCVFAKSAPDARAFFESFFQPVLIEDAEPMLFTGYFEPELRGSKGQGGQFQYQIYSLPNDHVVELSLSIRPFRMNAAHTIYRRPETRRLRRAALSSSDSCKVV